MKYEGEIKVTFKGDGIDTISFPKMVESFPEKQHMNEHVLWQTHGKDERLVPVTVKAQKNLEDVCAEFAKMGFIGCKKEGKRKLTSIKYVLQTSLGGYTFVKSE